MPFIFKDSKVTLQIINLYSDFNTLERAKMNNLAPLKICKHGTTRGSWIIYVLLTLLHGFNWFYDELILYLFFFWVHHLVSIVNDTILEILYTNDIFAKK